MSAPPRPPLLALVGPTAAGKTLMGVEVAEALSAIGHPCEIVSCDSMGVYRRLDIAADKPSAELRERIPHHLFDLVDPDEEYTAVRYRDAARTAIADITARSRIAMLVGGSGLYFRAVVDDLDFAPTSPDVRARLERADPAELYARLERDDPPSAESIDPRNVRRVVRAVEVLELTGRPASEMRTTWDRHGQTYRLCAAGLTWADDVLLERATERVDSELTAGLVDEVRRVMPDGISKTAVQALGVKEVLEHVRGERSLHDARDVLVRNTKRFVRRQRSWFGADARIVWFSASELGWDGACTAIVDRFRRSLDDGVG